MEPAVKIDGLVKRYGDVVAVDGLCLEVPPGNIYGLLGPDGAGKTTTLRCMTGGLSFQGGEARIFGRDLKTQLTAIRPLIGYMPQRFALYQDLTLDENLNFFADLYQVSKEDRATRIPQLMGFTRLDSHRKKLAGQLSGGMKQKLALSTVLVHRPKMLFLDEPSTGVDPVSRREFWQILLALKDEGVAIMVSTPYMDEAEKCDKVGMMVRGKLLIEGTPQELRAAFPFKLLAIVAEPLFPARQALGRLPGVRTAVLHGDAVHIVVEDAEAVRRQVPDVLAAAGVRVGEIRDIEAGLEDVFVHELASRGLVTPRSVQEEGEADEQGLRPGAGRAGDIHPGA